MNAVVVSPYHLTTREAPAMAAMLLAGRACTLLPVPTGGETREAVTAALEHSPRYRRLLNNWLLLAPLFDAGVITTLDGGADPVTLVRGAAGRIAEEEQWGVLRPFAHAELFGDDGDSYLDVYAADLLKGGPDPGISLPTCAGLDAFAAERGLPVFRAGVASTARPRPPGVVGGGSGGGSLAQQVEGRLGEQLFSVGLPILKQAGARALLGARAALEPQLRQLRVAVAAAIKTPDATTVRAVRSAGASYSAAFKNVMTDRVNRDDEGGTRLTQAFVSLTARRLSPDAALISSVAAFNRAAGESARGVSPAPAPLTSAGDLVTLTVTPLDVEPL